MPDSRTFLDWKKPILPQTAAYLIERFSSAGEIDLRNLIVVLPTSLATDRLLELLVENSANQSRRLVPPRLVTLFDLPELLYTPKRRFADGLTQKFAWTRALESLKAHERAQLMRRFAETSLAGGLALASLMSELHRELAANRLSFASVAENIASTGEIARWELLKKLENAYLRTLDGLELWDRQTARLVALEKKEFETEAEVVLVGIVDLNASQRAMLSQVRDRVSAVVAAPAERKGWFDKFGSLVTDRWARAPLEGIYERTETVDGPDDQALAVCRVLNDWNGEFTADEITVGVPDRRIAPAIEQRLTECGLTVRNDFGRPLIGTGPARLLRSTANFLESGWFRDFASLARHPDLELWLKQQGVRDGWLLELDDYSSKHFPDKLDSAAIPGSAFPQLRNAAARLEAELKPFRGRKRPVGEWAQSLRGFLLSIYGFRELCRDRKADLLTGKVCGKIQDVLASLEDLPKELAPKVTGAEALELVLHELEGKTASDRAGQNEISLAGWLELPWDDASATIVTGFNEGIVPQSKNPDAFLPNGLRRQMDLDDNDRRFARDAYALSLLAASRKRLRLIAGRRTEENDPLTPSRLLFACEPKELPARVQRAFSKPRSLKNRVRIAGGLAAGRDEPAFYVPQPERLKETVDSMRVTEFSVYLECPYRYYLAYRLRLKAPETTAEELPPNTFGDLIHDVLEAFGRDATVNRSLDPERIFEFLSDTLTGDAERKFSDQPKPAVRIQIELARQRLRAFANWQAGWASEGWQVLFAEQSVQDERANLIVDDKPMLLRGRIDRIDVREHATGTEIAILDYKTGDLGKSPEKKHRDNEGNWIDLQLPLYRHLIRALDDLPESDAVQLGYILLPKDSAATGAVVADWSEEDLAKADETAADVIRKVREESFWPPNPNPRYFSEFAAICQDDLFGAAMQADAEE